MLFTADGFWVRISKFTILYELLLLKQPQLDNVADGLWMSFVLKMSLHCMLIKFTILYVLILLDLNSWTGLTATVKGCGGHLLTSLHWMLNCSVLITSFSGLSFCPLYILRRLNQVNLHIKSILKSRYDIFSHKRRYNVFHTIFF